MAIARTTSTKVFFGGAAALLLLPAVGNLVSTEVNWGPEDFLVMGLLLFAAAWAGNQVWQRFHSPQRRILLLAVVAAVFVLVWAEMAVGIFGSPIAGS